jgi:hypothetical protein
MMATFTDSKAFVQHLGQYGDKVKAAVPGALNKAALAATRDIRAEAKGFHIGRKKLNAGYTVASDTAIIQARGPWGIVEKGSRPHPIGPKRRRGKGRRGVVVVPGRGVFAHVNHPGHGSLGKPWEQGVAKAKVSGPTVFRDVIRKAMSG